MRLLILAALVLATPAPEPAPPNKKVLWDAWYTRTVGPLRYSYYQETTTEQNGRIHIQTHEFKNEEGFINEEHVGVLAENNKTLTPVLLNGMFKYRTNQYQIDAARTPDGKRLQFTLKKAGEAPRAVTKTPSPIAFFSTHFGVWLHRTRPTKRTPFVAIREDDPSGEFPTVKGWVEPDKKTGNTWRINYGGLIMFWTLDSDGAPSRVEVPAQNQVTLRTSRAEAEKFLH